MGKITKCIATYGEGIDLDRINDEVKAGASHLDIAKAHLAEYRQNHADIVKHIETEYRKTLPAEDATIASAREAMPSIPNEKVFEIENDDGSIDSGSASELMARADVDMAFAEQSDKATSAAINCYLKWGDV